MHTFQNSMLSLNHWFQDCFLLFLFVSNLILIIKQKCGLLTQTHMFPKTEND